MPGDWEVYISPTFEWTWTGCYWKQTSSASTRRLQATFAAGCWKCRVLADWPHPDLRAGLAGCCSCQAFAGTWSLDALVVGFSWCLGWFIRLLAGRITGNRLSALSCCSGGCRSLEGACLVLGGLIFLPSRTGIFYTGWGNSYRILPKDWKTESMSSSTTRAFIKRSADRFWKLLGQRLFIISSNYNRYS